MTTQNPTSLNALFTSKATDIHSLVNHSIEQGKIVNLPTATEVNQVFLSLPKANRDKTTYILVFTLASLNDEGKLQHILDKAINTTADKETGFYVADKAVSKMISLVKSYIALGIDLIDSLSTYKGRFEHLHEANARLCKEIDTLNSENADLTEQLTNV